MMSLYGWDSWRKRGVVEDDNRKAWASSSTILPLRLKGWFHDNTGTKVLTGGFFGFFCYVLIQHCFICHPSDSTVSEDAGIEPRTVHGLEPRTVEGIETRTAGDRTQDCWRIEPRTVEIEHRTVEGIESRTVGDRAQDCWGSNPGLLYLDEDMLGEVR